MPVQPTLSSSRICVAVILAAHGVKGHVKIKCFLEDPKDLKSYSPFSNERGEGVYKLDKILNQKQDVLIVSLEGITDRNAAEQLNGVQLTLPEDRLPELSEETFYHKDLIGLSVKSAEGALLGKVKALYNFGAGNLLEIQTQNGKFQMIPFTHGVVPKIDQEEGALYVSEEGEVFLEGGQDAS